MVHPLLKRAAMIASALTLAALPGAVAFAKTPPSQELDALARDVGRLESLRTVKTLQKSYAHYAQYGLWGEVADLFAEDATFVFDGETISGKAAIRDFLAKRYGAGADGLADGKVSTMLIETPLINLSADGESAKGRWHFIAFLAAAGDASIEGGIFENDYAREDGAWRIKTARYYPQYAGPYETGWTNWGGGDLPLVPYHYTPDEAGVPIPAPTGEAPASKADKKDLARRIEALNAEDEVRNLQSAYGYYLDRKMWDDVVDLFTDDAAYEVGGVGVYRGKKGVRKALLRSGQSGLTFGELKDYPQFDTLIKIMPNGREAFTRGIEIGMIGDATREEAQWEIRVFHNRFVKEDGVWKIRELRVFPLLKADYFEGWGKSRIVDPAPEGDLAPDAPSPMAKGAPLPAFLTPHPATGRNIAPGQGAQLRASKPLTGVAHGKFSPGDPSVEELRRRLSRSVAWDAFENLSAAYSDYLDDFQSTEMGAIFAKDGFKVSAFAGYYIGGERIAEAARLVFGDPPTTRPGISFHWRIQPVIHVAEDGRSANLRIRLFQPRTWKEESRPGAFYAAGFHSGIYHDQAVLEDGIWRFWNLSLDEPYFYSVDWKGGWAKAKPRPVGERPNPSPLFGKYEPDVPLLALGVRMEHFRGGTGNLVEWPGIQPMWFSYRNPVSGRETLHYMPECVPCVVAPELDMTRHGYMTPPNGPTPQPEK